MNEAPWAVTPMLCVNGPKWGLIFWMLSSVDKS